MALHIGSCCGTGSDLVKIMPGEGVTCCGFAPGDDSHDLVKIMPGEGVGYDVALHLGIPPM